MTAKKWKLVVYPLSGSNALHQFELEAPNWMGALRAARKQLGEDGGLPSGASCAVTPDGTVTILDGEMRRRFVLTALAAAAAAPAPAPEVRPLPEPQPAAVKPAKFKTVAYAPSPLAQPPQPSAAGAKPVILPGQMAKAPAAHPVADQKPPAKATTSSSALAAPGGRPQMQLELMLTRDVEPGPDNPLTYRERAYLMPKGMSVRDAEAALRFALADLQREFENAPRGKFVNLAAFDHDWIDRPRRPPLVSLEWRDWRGEPSVDYPAAQATSVPPGAPDGDERLATVFESLHELSQLRSPAEGLEFSVRLLAHAVGSEALSGCLYDINTDELRFVAVLGTGAGAAQGRAVSRTAGLFGKAAAIEHAALVVPDVTIEPGYDSARDGRQGLVGANMLLRPLTHDGHLLGMLQLINRVTGGFSAADVHVVNYLAERLAEFLHEARTRTRS